MKDVLVYRPPDTPAQAALFIESLEPKLREKLLRQIIPLPRMPPLHPAGTSLQTLYPGAIPQSLRGSCKRQGRCPNHLYNSSWRKNPASVRFCEKAVP